MKKIKFVTKSNMGEYITEDNRLSEWGGSDEWQYRWESENTDLLLKLMQQVHKPALNSGQNSNKTCPGPGPIKVRFFKTNLNILRA